MDELRRARSIKAEIEKRLSILHSPNKKPTGKRHDDEDCEDKLIKTLRCDQNMKWKEITNILNQRRLDRGEAANMTSTAIYSRFVRNSPQTATAVGEIGFDSRDYVHLRHPNQYTETEGTGTISKAGKKRIRNYENATELKHNIRKRAKLDEHKDLVTAAKTEQLMNAVAKVERNFWLLVADEMERMTTKMYQPNELASRYHAI